MNAARKHYKDLLLAKEWMKMDEKQQSILALQTKIEEVKAQMAKGKCKGKGKYKTGGSNEWAWKCIPPRPDESRTKKIKGKMHYWCNNHQIWYLHKASECKLEQEPIKKMASKKENKNKLKMKVYQSLLESTSEEEDQEDQESNEEEMDGEDSTTSE